MKLSSSFLAVLTALVCCAFAQRDPDCGLCNYKSCLSEEKLAKCSAGTVPDRCGCCKVCAKGLNELCQHPRIPPQNGQDWGQCGDNLKCELRDDLEEGDAPEALCQCRIEGVLCGSDGVTYENLCELSEAAITMGKRITVKSRKPCPSAPWLVSLPENTKDIEGASIALICEARGFPIPNIEWTWTRVDGKVVELPSDDLHISVNMRGGPEKHQITGWLQVFEMKKIHEGDYTCFIQNQLGLVNATARVNVVAKDDEEYEKYRKFN